MGPRRYLGSILMVLLLGLAALSAPWMGFRRPLSLELQAGRIVNVIASGDSGSGTLREALFTAAQAGERVRIVIHPRRIRLRTPLPPVLGAEGVVIDAMSSRCELDGAAVAGGPLLEIMSRSTTVAGLGLRNARAEGVVVRANNVLLRGLTLTKCGDGISVAGTSEQTTIEDSTFVENNSGIRISPQSRSVIARNNEFQRHEQAGIWASAATPPSANEPRPLLIQRNRFEEDRISIALVNVAGLIESNEIRQNREMGIYLLGSRSIVRGNSIHRGVTGILTESVHGAIVEQNQIDRTQVALLVRNSRNLAVSRNRVYSNAFGLAVIFGGSASPVVLSDNLVSANTLDAIYVVGASPLIRKNQVIQNGGAAARILDFVPWNGPRVPATPRLEANTFRANGLNEAISGEYRTKPEEKE